jgi:hypothetical protein
MLFIDTIEDYEKQEASLVYNTLNFKLKNDLIYPKRLGYMSRAYFPIIQDNFFNLKESAKARKLQEIKSKAEDFLSEITHMVLCHPKAMKKTPDILFICGHGLDGDEHEKRYGWSNCEGKLVLSFQDLKGLCNIHPDICIISNSCAIGRKDIAGKLFNMGFRYVVAWPAATCMTETYNFHNDFFEFIAFSYLWSKTNDFGGWLHQDRIVHKAFEFAVCNLKQRYTASKQVAVSPDLKPNQGHYLHTETFLQHYSVFPEIIAREK